MMTPPHSLFPPLKKNIQSHHQHAAAAVDDDARPLFIFFSNITRNIIIIIQDFGRDVQKRRVYALHCSSHSEGNSFSFAMRYSSARLCCYNGTHIQEEEEEEEDCIMPLGNCLLFVIFFLRKSLAHGFFLFLVYCCSAQFT